MFSGKKQNKFPFHYPTKYRTACTGRFLRLIAAPAWGSHWIRHSFRVVIRVSIVRSFFITVVWFHQYPAAPVVCHVICENNCSIERKKTLFFEIAQNVTWLSASGSAIVLRRLSEGHQPNDVPHLGARAVRLRNLISRLGTCFPCGALQILTNRTRRQTEKVSLD